MDKTKVYSILGLGERARRKAIEVTQLAYRDVVTEKACPDFIKDMNEFLKPFGEHIEELDLVFFGMESRVVFKKHDPYEYEQRKLYAEAYNQKIMYLQKLRPSDYERGTFLGAICQKIGIENRVTADDVTMRVQRIACAAVRDYANRVENNISDRRVAILYANNEKLRFYENGELACTTS